MPFSSDQIVNFYYPIEKRETIDDHVVYQCVCSVKRKVAKKTGFTNLLSHVTKSHPAFETEMRESFLKSGKISFINQKAFNITQWIDFILTSNSSFSIVENESLRALAKHTISRDSITKYILKTCCALKKKIALQLESLCQMIYLNL